ncbi:inactive C-alpha-formylglycine-generating enzyme 2-like [Actinia tenebrosa]|uniref:Inactive C-alpha-formylglycine-generating enzyme 2-like n=1 Tax=Actinia tenebrosa TaxID=6105 RepID=A0A6P8HF97_ACTTE|nr:inactive C-alpha-formylglycine-generating enzyme 2-like [Actinia tenebrosa]
MALSLVFFSVFFLAFNVQYLLITAASHTEMVKLSGGRFKMGTDAKDGKDGEGPSKMVKVKSFLIDKFPVTNENFRKFVREKNYKSEAEKFGWSFAFFSAVPAKTLSKIKQSVQGAPWWIPVNRAFWRQPQGPGTSIKDKMKHPAVHISYNDANEYCKWAGKRLPTEKEWEFAARGGLRDNTYPWGNNFEEKRMNIWQGRFPHENTKDDGYHWTAAVDAFPPQNDYGMCDMVGNAWEWVSDELKTLGGGGEKKFVLRGGSYLDSVDGAFNHIARVTTRMGNTADAGSDNITFRCAKNIPKVDL